MTTNQGSSIHPGAEASAPTGAGAEPVATEASFASTDVDAILARHAVLAKHCGASKADLLAALREGGEHGLCVKCASMTPAIRMLLIIFEMTDRATSVISARCPPDADQAACEAYIDTCRRDILRHVDTMPAETLRKNACAWTLEYGALFTGRIVHPGVCDAHMVPATRDTLLPHLSSRSLKRAGVVVPMDQSKNDNRPGGGPFKALVEIVEKRHGDIEIGLSDAHMSALCDGMNEAIETMNRAPIDRVDFRLRQLLLPDDERAPHGYLAVTPLTAIGESVLLANAAEAVIASRKEPEVEDENPAPDASGPDAQNAGVVIKVKTAKAAKAAAAKGGAENPVRFDRVDLEVGGANAQNITFFTKSAQKFFTFGVPRKGGSFVDVLRFAYNRKWEPSRSIQGLGFLQDAVLTRVAGLGASMNLSGGKGVSILAKLREVRSLVAAYRSAVLRMSDSVADTTISIDGSEAAVLTPETLKSMRGRAIRAIDLAVLSGHLGSDYAEEMSEVIVKALVARDARNVKRHGGAVVVNQPQADGLVEAVRQIIGGLA